METEKEISRRALLLSLAAGATLGASRPPAVHRSRPRSNGSNLRANAPGFTPAPALPNPNVLVIIVDQLRMPMWLNTTQQTMVNNTLLPNIYGRIQSKAYNFQQYYIASSCCTPARSSMLTGLYTAQNGMYIGSNSPNGPVLNPAFPTFATAMALLNPLYRGNAWWFGKWHISYPSPTSTLLPYGFNTRTYPGGAAGNPSPNGWSNEGVNGGLVTTGPYAGQTWCSDAQITSDFVAWLQGQKNGAAPWCSTVSLINPHDIAFAPGYLPPTPTPPPGLPVQPISFPQPTGTPPSVYTAAPYPWNTENLQQTANKPYLQSVFQNGINASFGTVSSWTLFLNQYYWLQNIVDQQVGLILNALYSSPFANNTIVVFASDHGEYAGSHGLHDKGGAVYDEGIRVPLSILFPNQTSPVVMNQMCSGVDFFGLMCDLASGGTGQWRLAYPDLANRQSLWSFLSSNSPETRVTPGPLGLPYILTSFDEIKSNENGVNLNYAKSHIVCLRTKNDPAAGLAGGKLAYYSAWASCTNVQDPAVTADTEFYDYNVSGASNPNEMGNDAFSNNAVTQTAFQQHQQALGNVGANPSGLFASEFSAPLVGKGNDGNSLSQTSRTAIQTYVNYINNTGPCPA